MANRSVGKSASVLGMLPAYPGCSILGKVLRLGSRIGITTDPSLPYGRCTDAVELEGSQAAIARFVRASLFVAIREKWPSIAGTAIRRHSVQANPSLSGICLAGFTERNLLKT